MCIHIHIKCPGKTPVRPIKLRSSKSFPFGLIPHIKDLLPYSIVLYATAIPDNIMIVPSAARKSRSYDIILIYVKFENNLKFTI